jgi:hypothetical protein
MAFVLCELIAVPLLLSLLPLRVRAAAPDGLMTPMQRAVCNP